MNHQRKSCLNSKLILIVSFEFDGCWSISFKGSVGPRLCGVLVKAVLLSRPTYCATFQLGARRRGVSNRSLSGMFRLLLWCTYYSITTNAILILKWVVRTYQLSSWGLLILRLFHTRCPLFTTVQCTTSCYIQLTRWRTVLNI